MAIEDRGSSHREEIVGLDVGDCLVTAARLQVGRDGAYALTHAGWAEYPAGATDRQMAQTIRKVWRQFGMSAFTVACTLRSQSLAIKYFRYPGLTESDLPAALRLEAEESLQMPAEQVALDWQLSRGGGSAQGNGAADKEGVLVAVPNAEVERHLAILRMAGLYPIILDVACLALTNLFLDIKGRAPEQGAVCLVNLGRRSADLAVLFNGHSVYPRVVFARAADWSSSPDYLLASVDDVLKYYQFKLRHDPVQQVLVCGQIAVAPGFVEKVSAVTGVRAEVWNPLRNLTVGLRASRALGKQAEELGPALATCLGLALRRG